jgi:hypothetical protein
MRPIFRTALAAAVLMLAACSSATPDASRAPTQADAPTAVAPAAPVVNDAPAVVPAQAQGKPRFIDFYATW